jgi:hypothetical protein
VAGRGFTAQLPRQPKKESQNIVQRLGEERGRRKKASQEDDPKTQATTERISDLKTESTDPKTG